MEAGKKAFNRQMRILIYFKIPLEVEQFQLSNGMEKCLKSMLAYCLAVFHPTKQQRLCLTNSKLAEGSKKIFIIVDESVRVLNNMWPNKLLQLPTLAVARSYFYEPYMYFTNLHCEKNEKIVFIFPTKHFRFLLVWASVQIQLLK